MDAVISQATLASPRLNPSTSIQRDMFLPGNKSSSGKSDRQKQNKQGKKKGGQKPQLQYHSNHKPTLLRPKNHIPHTPHSNLLPLLILLHPLHNPPTRLLGILITLLLVPHDLLHLKLIRDIRAPHNRGSLLNCLSPKLNLVELVRNHARPFAPFHPAENANVCETVFVADEVGRRGGGKGVQSALGGEAVVEHGVQALGFGLVAVDRVGDLFGGVWGIRGLAEVALRFWP